MHESLRIRLEAPVRPTGPEAGSASPTLARSRAPRIRCGPGGDRLRMADDDPQRTHQPDSRRPGHGDPHSGRREAVGEGGGTLHHQMYGDVIAEEGRPADEVGPAAPHRARLSPIPSLTMHSARVTRKELQATINRHNGSAREHLWWPVSGSSLQAKSGR